MKWAVIGIVALVVLGGAGYAIYTLTDAPEQAQEWWDEKKLDNFDTLAKRELDDFEKKIAEHKAALTKLKADKLMWSGKEGWDGSFKKQDTGFFTVLYYDDEIKHRTGQGKALGDAYMQAKQAAGATIDAGGNLAAETTVSVTLPQRDGTTAAKEWKAADIMTLLGKIETELTNLENDRKSVTAMAAQYDESIAAWEKQIATEESELDNLRKEVAKIASEIKLHKAKEDLDKLNKTIKGDSEDSSLGKLIRSYEKRKSSFEREALVAGDAKAKETSEVSLDDLDKPSSVTGATKSRFLK